MEQKLYGRHQILQMLQLGATYVLEPLEDTSRDS